MTMRLTVTFHDAVSAAAAASRLTAAGFRPGDLQVVDAASDDRHAFIRRRTADVRRATILGILIGSTVGFVTTIAFSGVFGLSASAAISGSVSAGCGTLLGFVIGRTTSSELRQDLERAVDMGHVLLGLRLDRARLPRAIEAIEAGGESCIIASTASFTVGSTHAEPAARSA